MTKTQELDENKNIVALDMKNGITYIGIVNKEDKWKIFSGNTNGTITIQDYIAQSTKSILDGIEIQRKLAKKIVDYEEVARSFYIAIRNSNDAFDRLSEVCSLNLEIMVASHDLQ